ncbi:hypothetical protein ASD11_10100 [Aeromicrobium sp. Root495]|nr:hypothetical protein ASD11_10100 [Aeromicrobium sp. Root495]
MGRALVRACHPEPSGAVTVAVVLLALHWGASAGTAVLVGVAALTGQLSVGWSNDYLDRERDRISGRRDKPLATGALGVGTVRVAIVAAALVTVAASLCLGVRAGALHLALVAMAWGYNLGLKSTILSWMPYAVCFGGLPAVVSLAVRDDAGPPWLVVAGVLLGTGAHLVNAVPDLEDDRRTGVHGLPHRLGARGSVDLATALLLAGTVVTAVVPADGLDLVAVVALSACAVLLVVGRVAPGRGPFLAAVGIALVNVVSVVVRT